MDLDVSALNFSPFTRPQLGKWLALPDEYDAIVWWRFDRAVASMSDMHDLAGWAKEHRKMLVFEEGVGSAGRLVFDFRNPMDPLSELMMMLFAFAAQVESLTRRCGKPATTWNVGPCSWTVASSSASGEASGPAGGGSTSRECHSR
ncbi:recombinase family protein [Streptomyces griseorubiginosus]|uniref:recombinase family protein n=1 Tax=Streptomyces griseorubiginosus TaxID=67304 RepID=UPI0027E37C91|nr:recombinase family protein [Streptomyces griseorubiginosus]